MSDENTIGTKENAAGRFASELSAALAPMPEEPTEAQLADACMWHRHDFGLQCREIKEREMFAMRERWRAIWKAINTPGRGAEFL